MAEYREISDAEVAVDAPITAPLMQALKDNQEAIFTGATGAPYVTALGCGAVVAGDYLLHVQHTLRQTTGGQEAISHKMPVIRGGTYRVRLIAKERAGGVGGGSWNASFFVNNVNIFTTGNATNSGDAEATQDVTVEAGDILHCKIGVNSGTDTDLEARFMLGGDINAAYHAASPVELLITSNTYYTISLGHYGGFIG